METIHLKATATQVTDQGVFEAVISTMDSDRELDIVVPEAMVTALKKWNRPIPLAWEHSTDPDDIFGTIEPMTARVADGSKVVAQGQVDLDSRVGQAAWRAFKARSIGFSFGYLIPEGGMQPRKGGGRHITELDVFEITATRTPMNNDTEVLSTKSAEELREEADRVERGLQDEVVDAAVEDIPDEVPVEEPFSPEPEPEPKTVMPPEVVQARITKFERKLQDEIVEAVEVPKTEPVEPEPEWVKAIAGLEERLDVMVKEREAKSPEEIRDEAVRAERKLQDEVVEAVEPDLPESVEEEPPWAKAIADVTEKLESLREQVKKSANQPSDTERLDSLRKKADDAELAIKSNGEHLAKPPKKEPEPEPDLPPASEIRRKARNYYIGILSRENLS